MQRIFDRAMFLERTRGAYGVGFPERGMTFRPPAPGTFMHTLLFTALATNEEYEAHYEAVRENMEGWKARVKASSGKSALLSVRGIDTSKLNISI